MKNSKMKSSEREATGDEKYKRPRSLKSFLVVLFVFGFLLNWFWEIIQTPAYETMSGFSQLEKIYIITRASLADAAITLGIYGITALAARQPRWGLNGEWKSYPIFALLGAAAATIIELTALTFDYWRYGAQMPIVPVLGIGLSPFLQLTLLVPIALWLARWWSGRNLE